MVPLTNSLYVPGKLRDPENVIIDIGTGYYVSKVRVVGSYTVWILIVCSMQSRKEAIKHYESKIDFIRGNLETLQETIQKKQENMTLLVNIMQSKLQAQAAAKNKD